MYTSEDSLTVTESEDGSYQISWDPNDPRYFFLNDKSEEELNEIFHNAIDQAIKHYETDEQA